MIKNFIITLLITLIAVPSYADEASHRAVAEELFKLAKAEEAMKPLETASTSMMEQSLRQASTCFTDEIIADIVGEVKEILDMEGLIALTKKKSIELYIQNFTEEEITEIVAFYKSEVGQKMVDSMPKIMQQTLPLGQKYAAEKMPKIQEFMQGVIPKYINKDKSCKKPE